MNTNDLNEWNEYGDGETSTGRPQWYKLWCEKYADALDIENLDKDLTPKEKNELFKEIGKVFINSLFYFLAKRSPRAFTNSLSTRPRVMLSPMSKPN